MEKRPNIVMPPSTLASKIGFSVIVPIYNEELAIKKVIEEIKIELDLNAKNYDYEILAINDASTDKTLEILKNIEGIKIINHPYNKGNGASIKTGAMKSTYDWLLCLDGDGQHKPEHIKYFIQEIEKGEYDLVSGWRQGYKGPWIRQPGKKLLHLTANYLAERRIPDFNCGFRLIKKEHFLRYKHLFPDNFSIQTTSLLAFLKDGLNVKYIPLTINKRVGKSMVRISHMFTTLLTIVRLIMLFSPLKIFLPIAFAGIFISTTWIIHDLIISNFSLISKSSGFLLVISFLVLLFGLLADQIAAIRRELKK